MLEENKKIHEENAGCLVTLLVWVLLITVGFGIVVGLYALVLYDPEWICVVMLIPVAIIGSIFHYLDTK
jgi:hypothetical protein